MAGYLAPSGTSGYLAKPGLGTWSVVDGDMSVGALGDKLILDADGDTYITCATDDEIDFYEGGTRRLQLANTAKFNAHVKPWADNTQTLGDRSTPLQWKHAYIGTSIYIAETAAAAADTAGAGQIWVKNASPCELWFTDDAGADTKLA